MLCKINRLKKEADFERVFKGGKSFREGFLFLKIKKNNLENSRFGFVVSKKNAKKAFLRNKIKRSLREAVRGEIKNIKKGIDGIIMISGYLEEEKPLGTGESLKKLFKKAGLL